MDEKYIYNKEIDIEDSTCEDSIFPSYVRCQNIHMSKLSKSSFSAREILDFYSTVDRRKKTDLPVYPSNLGKIYTLFEKIRNSWKSGEMAHYGVYERGSREYIGHSIVYDIDWSSSSCVISVCLQDSQDYCSELIEGLCVMLFDNINMSVIYIEEDEEIESNSIDDTMREFGGIYEGINRVVDDSGDIIMVNRWSIHNYEYAGTESNYGDIGFKLEQDNSSD